MAKQADSSVMVQYGGTVVLVSLVIAKEPKASVDFLPLTVEYQEKTYAAGKIPGGFFKREGRPSEKAILTSRLIDRPVRSLFPKGFRNEVQIVAISLSHDGMNDPDTLAMIGASAVLGLSPTSPVDQRLGVCRVGRVNNQFVLNPTYAEVEEGGLDLVVVTTKEGIVMVESGAREVSEEAMGEALRFAQDQAAASVRLQEELISACGVVKVPPELRKPDEAFLKRVRDLAEGRVKELLAARSQKEGGDDGRATLVKELAEKLATADLPQAEVQPQVAEAIEGLERDLVRQRIAKEGRRMDGRGLTDVRPITCEVGVLPRTHGSGLFTRGQTQSLASATLGTSSDEQIIDALQGKSFKSFMLHYNFPSFSVGEVRPIRGPGRREIGHGALAERSLRAVMPAKEAFPYTVRLVSEILESNGSSSMATVCGGTLALMDAGVPIKGPVSGIAMGLIHEGGRYTVLTDIIGLEDHYGDMDFKVAGTAAGITALQLDLKLTGVPVEVLIEAIQQAKPARAFVLGEMLKALSAPRADLSPFAPRITLLKIDPEKIGELIGPGGKMIRKITQESGATIDVEDDGTVMVASADAAAAQKAINFIKGLTEEAEIGRVYQGVVRRITNFGAFCEIAPGKEGLCHVSELSSEFVPKVEDVVKLGDTLAVKVVEIDSMGRINLSHKQALLPPGTPPVPPARRGAERGGDRGGRSGGGDYGRGGFSREHRRPGESHGDRPRHGGEHRSQQHHSSHRRDDSPRREESPPREDSEQVRTHPHGEGF
ncbi:MAG: polyribonucleotide nucleotidyltransferase [Candidatus Omnitrophica bacterium]|nr:polyribonucleotide nucleotidyltransferase [Candidatus Omnitrophota bacterium]